MSKTYAAAGVDLAAGDSFSAFAGAICRNSFKNSSYVKVTELARSHFRGPRGYEFVNLPKGCLMDSAPDGIGTKVILIDAVNNPRTAAHNLLAMTEEDISRWGGLPLVLVNILDVKTLGKNSDDPDATEVDIARHKQYRDMIAGLGDACREQGIVCFRGETAELGHCVSSENPNGLTQFNWGGMVTGVHHPDKLITGSTLQAGHWLVALRDPSPGCNGYSGLRMGLREHFGTRWYDNPAAKSAVSAAAEPTPLYSNFLATANGWFEPDFQPLIKMHVIVHLTGGPFKSKLWEDILCPLELSAELTNLWDPPQVVRDCAEWLNMGDEECYEVFAAGQRVLVAVDKNDFNDLVTLATKFGIHSQYCGLVTQKKPPTLTIHSKFRGEKVVWPRP